jgi:hypothetical protein
MSEETDREWAKRVDELTDAIDQAVEWFEEYERLHLAKKPPDETKAASNRAKATYLRSFL